MRVYELARELEIEPKAVLERAVELGVEVKTASSGLDDDAVALVKLSYENGAPASEEPAEAETAAAASPDPAEPVAEPSTEDPASVPTDTDGGIEDLAAIPAAERQRIVVPEGITGGDFARLIGQRMGDVMREMMTMGELVSAAGPLPAHVLPDLGKAFGFNVTVEAPEVVEASGPQPYRVQYEDDPLSLTPRAPVVTVMGHVDHGKTQLLDTIRSANVVAGEAGGITQHIGAYQVQDEAGTITFIDTPGHEAFTALRARGADVTDIAVIVVAANDGVMPQTAEAINHAKAANVPVIVAINKMDLDTADPYAVRAALTQHEVVVEDLGGDVVSAEISALTGEGIDHLLEMIALVAEVEDLRANPGAPAVGTVIESQLEVGRGPVATVIVQRGTLKRGDSVAAGPVAGRVRAMFDENGAQLKTAGPSTPVLVTGWDEVPQAGDMFEVVKNERTARKLAGARVDQMRSANLTVPTATERLGMLLDQLRTADHAELTVVIKADAHGSLEAIRDAVANIKRDDAKVTIIHGAVGGITANDLMLAEASNAIVYGFNVRPDAGARKAAKEAGTDVRTFSIIYELLADIESLLVGELAPDEVEAFIGVADVRAVFRAPRFGFVAGCYVTEGEIQRNAKARLVRDGVVVYDGRITSLRRFKDDVPSVAVGFECGIGLENFRDIKEGDTIESYEVKEVART